MLEEGYIKIHRSILKWEWYDDPNTFRLFMHLILTANYYDEKWRGITIERGQRIVSYSKLSKETGLSVRSIRTCINKLKATGELTYITTSKYGLVTIINYNKYQTATDNLTGERQASDSQATGERQQIKKANKANKAKNKEITPLIPLEGKAVFEIILNDKSYHGITQDDIDKWIVLYPAVNVLQELRNMIGWCNANPAKRKTKAGINRFINSWLSKRQDKGGEKYAGNNEEDARTDTEGVSPFGKLGNYV